MVRHVMQHVTPEENIESIREKGLLARDPVDRWRGDAFYNPHVGVYLTTDQRTIEGMKRLTGLCHGKDTVVFDVDVTGLPFLIDKIEPRNRKRVCVPHDIPPDRVLGLAA